MRKILIYFLLLPSCAFAQVVKLNVSNNFEWAQWFYESIEFKDDCTILRGYFIPFGNGCWVRSKMDETLTAKDKEYHIIYTTLPINRHPRKIFKGGVQVKFEEHFEPIYSTDGIINLISHNISFSIPFQNREVTKPYKELFSSFENHIDTLISLGKYGRAAYLLSQYLKMSWSYCSPKAKNEIMRKIISKYRVQNFFMNASPDDQNVLSHFKNIYNCLNFHGDDEIQKELDEINSTSTLWNISINMNGKHLPVVVSKCETLMSKIRKYGKYSKCYENFLTLYRKALIMDKQTQEIPELDKEIIDVCSHIYDVNGVQYLERLMNVATDLDINFTKTTYETHISINIWKEVRDKAKKNFPNSWFFASALQRIADFNYHYRHYDIALMQYLTIDSMYKARRNEWIQEVWANHDYLSTEQSVTLVDFIQQSLSRAIGYCYYHKGDIINAVKHDRNNPYYFYALSDNDALVSWCKNSYKTSIEGLKSIIKEPTIIKPGAYYEEAFDVAYSPVLTIHIPYFAYKTNTPDLYKMAYNGALITKEFRLTAGNRLRQYIRSTHDSISLNYINRINREMCSYQYMIKTHKPFSQNKYWEIVQLQREFITYLDTTRALETYFPSWTDVRNALKEDELAIEFIEFPIWNSSQSVYAALTLRKDSEHPQMTVLFESKQLKQIPDTSYYQCKEMAKLVWTPIMAELKGIKDIYFSPSSALYNMGIEYLPGMEDYNIYRLSSTRELVTKYKSEKNTNAVLYGGLDYYAKTDTANTNRSLALLDETFVDHADVRGMGLRGGKGYLEHTKIEVDKIAEELSKAKWICLLDTASLGTEESFKALSGRKFCCLHISTHGFYYTKEEVDSADYKFLQLDNHIASEEDKALTRSGLIMAGANHILEGDTLPDNVEDGILTAKEIADVDLHGLDLVVLSACQTGLGDISQGEGVFGLQRGFKKAGANSILMSLWEVDDKATQILMTQFYKNLLFGQSKRQALLSAQKYLRNVEGGKYNEPKYWAAFILLDGIQ